MKQLKNMQEQLRKQMEEIMKNQQGKGTKVKEIKGKGRARTNGSKTGNDSKKNAGTTSRAKR